MRVVTKTKKFKGPNDKMHLLDKVLAFVLGVIVIVMFLQVVFRYIFNNSITWSEELIRYLFVWITFLGAALCFRDKMNIGVDFFINLLPIEARLRAHRANLSIMLLFTIFLFISGVVWVIVGGKSYGSSIPIQVNITLYSAVPISCLLIIYFLIRRMISDTAHRNNT